jgi:lipoprotein-anchoring transpeptidase ErfK/SrfK
LSSSKFSRRRFLTAAAALIAAPAAARAQGYPSYPPQAPYPGQPYPPQPYPGQPYPPPGGGVQSTPLPPPGAGQPYPPPSAGQPYPPPGYPDERMMPPGQMGPGDQPAQPAPGYGQHADPQPEEGEAADWYTNSPIPDGRFLIRRVNMEKVDAEFRRQLVNFSHHEQPGTIVIDPRQHFLYLLREGNTAIRYGVGTGREGFAWHGAASVGRKAEWPDWHPPKEMILRQPELPEVMPGGPDNPLGARALYLFEGNRDTLFRIHGTREPWTIGKNVSSGCIRLLNEEVADLYLRTPIGTRVVVM